MKQAILLGLALASFLSSCTTQPALDINLLTIKYIIDALDKKGVSHIPVAHTEELEALSETLKELGDAIKRSPANKLLKDI